MHIVIGELCLEQPKLEANGVQSRIGGPGTKGLVDEKWVQHSTHPSREVDTFRVGDGLVVEQIYDHLHVPYDNIRILAQFVTNVC